MRYIYKSNIIDTNGGFDIKKQAVLSANAAIDSIIDSGALHNKHMDKAARMAATILLDYRTRPEFLALANTVDIEVESTKIAQLIVGALVEKDMLRLIEASRAIEVVAEELFVLWSLESI